MVALRKNCAKLDRRPKPEEVALIVEISDSSLEYNTESELVKDSDSGQVLL